MANAVVKRYWIGVDVRAVVLAFGLGGFAAASASAAPASPDLDATVRYETRQVLANGTTRVETWQERMLRRGDAVWTERVIGKTASHEHESATEHAGHKHFDFDRAARLLRLDDKAEPRLQYVDRQHRQVVSVPKAEWGAVGFDGRYDAAAHLVPPALIAQMQPAKGSAARGESWLTQHAPGWTHRVLWSTTRQVALRIESARDDGSVKRVVVVTPAAPLADVQLPWRQLEAYQQLEYDDFMD